MMAIHLLLRTILRTVWSPDDEVLNEKICTHRGTTINSEGGLTFFELLILIVIKSATLASLHGHSATVWLFFRKVGCRASFTR